MSLVYPYFLFGLFVIALVAMSEKWIYSKERFVDIATLKHLIVGDGTSLHVRKKIGIYTALVLVVIALCRPVLMSFQESEKVDAKGVYLGIALDISKSMLAHDIYPNRLDFAKKNIETLISQLPHATISISAFSASAFLVSPFSEDKDTLRFLLKHLNQDSITSEGSSILSALKAMKQLYEPFDFGVKDILLVSDGADGREIKEAVEFAKKENFVVHIFAVGTQKGSPIYAQNKELLKDAQGNIVISKRDDSMAMLSDATGGVFVASVGESTDIKWLVSNIEKKIQKREMKTEQNIPSKELFYYPLFFAIAVLFISMFGFSFRHKSMASVLFLVYLSNLPLHAGIFDFLTIGKGEKAYEKGAFEEAQKAYEKLNKTPASMYNLANTKYKQGNYKEALKAYEEAKTEASSFEQKRLYNKANTLAKLQKIDEAIKSYEEALNIGEDEDARFNLELLKKQQKQKEQQQQKESQDEPKKDDKTDQSKQKDGSSQKQEPQKEEKNDKKDGNKEESKELPKDKIQDSLMSEQEAKKWEKLLQNQEIPTRPHEMVKGEIKDEKNAVTW
ncbi:MAG: tetratricopeptide repeat protein [Sulfurospirillaceae bacterium]|nr:tetratricopeptide repeat protein [Sulfurospirillaceae bacterium]MDD3462134.1 tetratricopeptide repeat protein [Sulfurospirillaceae bacterium]